MISFSSLLLASLLIIPHGQIAFVLYDGQQTDIYSILANGKQMKPLVTSEGSNESSPSWSSSGRMLLYTSDMRGNSDVYLYILDSGISKQITESSDIEINPKFHWDGKRISYERLSRKTDQVTSIWTSTLYGTDPIRITKNGMKYSWSSVNENIAFERDGLIISADKAGRNTKVLLPPKILAYQPQWSPHTEQLVVQFVKEKQMELGIITPGNITITNITHSEQIEEDPAWSPTGEYIAFVSRYIANAQRKKQTRRKVHIINITSQERISITDGSQECFSPSWSPDGSGLTYICCHVYPQCHIYVADVKSRTSRAITNKARAYSQPNWSPELMFRSF